MIARSTVRIHQLKLKGNKRLFLSILKRAINSLFFLQKYPTYPKFPTPSAPPSFPEEKWAYSRSPSPFHKFPPSEPPPPPAVYWEQPRVKHCRRCVAVAGALVLILIAGGLFLAFKVFNLHQGKSYLHCIPLGTTALFTKPAVLDLA